jgi:glycosyltransferase involved in cell wall biosynthesis
MLAHDLVVFFDHDWDANVQKNRQHFLIAELARQLEGCARVLGVERPICPLTDPFRKRAKFLSWLRGERGIQRITSNLYVYTPFVLMHNLIASRVPGVTTFNRFLMRVLLRAVLKRLEFQRDHLIAWIHHPYQLEEIGLVREKGLVYDCYDDYSSAPGSPARRRDLQQRERTVLERADWVFVVSEELLKSKDKRAKHISLVANGVEYGHFSRASTEHIESVPQRDEAVLGFTGKITSRLDFGLLARLAIEYPEWQMDIVGPQDQDEQLLQQPDYQAFATAPNVRLLGPKPYRDLPIYMRGFDVCILPYTAHDPFNVHCSPLKLYEYLATGKPIVSTDLPAVRPFSGLIRIARDQDEFARQTAAALKERDGRLVQRRLAAARENSWERRAEQVSRVLAEALAQRARDGSTT